MSETESFSQVRCRFAPSPTGYLHVGGARTALFNYLFAKRYGGTFILRIEDTDRERSTDEATQAIFDGLEWLRITPDEGPFFQSKRLELYRQYAKRLLQTGHAYACTCTQAELETLRKSQMAAGQKPQYNRKHRPGSDGPQPDCLPDVDSTPSAEPFVIRLRLPTEGSITFNDLILGDITTSLTEIDDFIIIRSDGTPTYNFTVVVDDIDMRISHVIRGMDHVSNTPKQIAIYQALGAALPAFAHVPMILGSDKKKLSKRHGATSVIEYKNDGYLPSAFVNYLVRLGWSYGDKEIFTGKELAELFNLDNVGSSAAVFDLEKLSWVNSEHIKSADAKELREGVAWFLQQQGINTDALEKDAAFQKLLDSLRPRARSLKEIANGCLWYFANDQQYEFDAKAATDHLTPASAPMLKQLVEKLPTAEPFTEASIEKVFQEIVATAGVKLVKLAQPARVAVTGSSASPPIYTVFEVLGRDRTLKRLERAIQTIV